MLPTTTAAAELLLELPLQALRKLQIQLLARELKLGRHLLKLLRLWLLLRLPGLLLQLIQQLLLLKLLVLLKLQPLRVVWHDGAGIRCHAGGILLLNYKVSLPRIQPHCRRRKWRGGHVRGKACLGTERDRT
jgi:hypothetical protein